MVKKIIKYLFFSILGFILVALLVLFIPAFLHRWVTTSLADHLKRGHLYTAFKSLGDAKGFMYYSMNDRDSVSGILGDSIKIDQVKTLNAVSPLPGQFRLIHDGKTVNVSSDVNYQYSWSEPIQKGAYRIEMHIKLKGEFIPWLYSNPIYVY